MDAAVGWYYKLDGGSHGPEPLHRILELLESGVISRTTLVMRSDGATWQSLDQALALGGHAPPPLPGSAGIALPTQPALNITTARRLSDPESQPHPWRRYFARMLDLLIGGLGMWFLIGLILAAVDQDSAKALTDFLDSSQNRVISGMGTALLAIFPDALLIGYTGTSIGKRLFGIRVTGQDGQPIGIGAAFKREILVWFRGLGLGFPIVSLVTLILAHNRLKNDGETSWDRDMSLQVRYASPTWVSLAAAAALFIIIVVIAALTDG